MLETAGTFLSICMHMRDFGEFETSASLMARVDEKLGIIARYAPCQPCLSAYIPVYMTKMPDIMQMTDRWNMQILMLPIYKIRENRK